LQVIEEIIHTVSVPERLQRVCTKPVRRAFFWCAGVGRQGWFMKPKWGVTTQKASTSSSLGLARIVLDVFTTAVRNRIVTATGLFD
jgi:hypothetical protein